MTALDKAFIKAYAPTRRANPPVTAPAIAPAAPASLPSNPAPTAPAEPIAPPSKTKRRARVIGHAPSALPAPHAIFSGPARRHTFKPDPAAATEAQATQAATTTSDAPAVAASDETPLAAFELPSTEAHEPKSAKAPASKANRSKKAAKRQPAEPSAAEEPVQQPANEETPKPEAAGPKRRTSPKYRLKTAVRDEVASPDALPDPYAPIESLARQVELTPTEDQPPIAADEAVQIELPIVKAAAENELTATAAEQIELPAASRVPLAPPVADSTDDGAKEHRQSQWHPATEAQPTEPSPDGGSKAGPSSQRRPLSDFVKPLPFEDAFHPHLEVDYFIWTTTVRSLVERGGPALNAFANQLTAQASHGEKVLALTGGRRGEGRTSVILAVARQIAERGGRVVIVDADCEKPDLARCVGLAPDFGWDQVLSGELPLEEVLITSLKDRLAIVPWHERLPVGSTPFDSLRAGVSLSMLRDHYDLVLVDGGPLSSDGKPNALASLVQAAPFDGGYLINDCRPQAAGRPSDPLRVARKTGLRIFGAIENFSALASEASEPQRTAA